MKSKILFIITITMIITATLFGCSNNLPDTTTISEESTAQSTSVAQMHTEAPTQKETMSAATYGTAALKNETSETEPSSVQDDTQHSEPEINFSDLE